ncbi:LysR family transcriptional regulator [Bradyrhizobium sp. WSM2254]|uniref:LysR family transcriptional regulator n=1 Tax=Bradyrhizobium sp. WSM2254 TaxID=1188263 RepID=UPI000481550A|nr:LysR family transcriptional regulator [Bradyrhizobium sp. WSM2254]
MIETNWDLFRLFVAVVRCGSVSRAAQTLGMSQPTLSRRIKELEQVVGAPLFFRVSSGVQLTSEGQDLHRSAAEMVAAFEAVQTELRSKVARRSAVVRISAPEGLTKHWLLPRIKKYQTGSRKIQVEISSTAAVENLVDRDLDLAMRIGDPGSDELVGRRVGQIGFGIFASKEYLRIRSAPRSLADLSGHYAIAWKRDEAYRRVVRRSGIFGLLDEVIDHRLVTRVTPMINHYAAASEGLGLACLAIPFARAEGLVQVLTEETGTLGIWLLRRRESDLRKQSRDFRRFLEAEFSKSKSWLAGAIGSST